MGHHDCSPGRSRLYRFFVAPGALAAGHVTFDRGQQHQLCKVLRLHDGHAVLVCDGSGQEFLTTLKGAGASLWGEVQESRPGTPAPRCQVFLYQSALRGDRFTWLLQKGAEIGVHCFIPVRFNFTQVADFAARQDRYQTVVREAAEQCGRSHLPLVLAPLALQDALAHSLTLSGATRLLLDEQEESRSFSQSLDPTVRTLCLFVGPEGGLAQDERRLAQAHGLLPVTLGSHILRSETAGIIAAALALQKSGDLG